MKKKYKKRQKKKNQSVSKAVKDADSQRRDDENNR